jgi:hypothetical protein
LIDRTSREWRSGGDLVVTSAAKFEKAETIAEWVGHGREWSEIAFDEFLETKAVIHAHAA